MRVIAGKAGRLLLKSVPGYTTRPTVDKYKETLFNILAPYIPGARFLDLFAGSGAIGIEALSRGAAECVFAEKDMRAVKVIRENLRHTKLDADARVMPGDAGVVLAGLDREGRSFDIIFMDPPYAGGFYESILTFLSSSALLNDDTVIVAEAALQEDFSFLEDTGLSEYRRKEYKTNMHVFIRRRGNG
ncbi:MAG: 16S rRNA (guanine(966)-N(2))-methyltransferase RsmD [Lachnospiraceae bacterium]|nr:16S rRNA (guanine(966)-N(2))-methyltransferase RsmD [Lachnospiraceae bacterium]